jgi:SAM-dependent methyltransferase
MTPMLKRWKASVDDLHFATGWIANWAHRQASAVTGRPARVLDVGMGTGRDLLAIRQRCDGIALELYGVEGQERYAESAQANGIHAFAADLERMRLPVQDGFFDLVVANHVIEHLKELPWFFSEISRVLVSGGLAIVGCPNLASWHNRIALLFGRQPPGIKVLGPHVRGFTRTGFKQFIQTGGYFEVAAVRGSNLYPVPFRWMNRALAATLPNLCASMHFAIRRSAKQGCFIELLDAGVPGMADTPYFRGD